MEIIEDNGLFRKLGLVNTFGTELNCSATQFRDYFEDNVGQGQTFIGIKRPKKEFQGSIGRSAFKMYRSMTMFDNNLTGASGTFSESGDRLKVDVWVYLPIGTFLIYSSVILVINIFAVTAILSQDKVQENIWPFILGLLVLLSFSTVWPFLAFKNGVKKLTFDIQREINYWTVKQTPHNTRFGQWRGDV